MTVPQHPTPGSPHPPPFFDDSEAPFLLLSSPNGPQIDRKTSSSSPMDGPCIRTVGTERRGACVRLGGAVDGWQGSADRDGSGALHVDKQSQVDC